VNQGYEKHKVSRRTLLKAAGTVSAGLAMEKGLAGRFARAEFESAASNETAIPTFCAMCGPGLGCGIYAYVKNGRFTRVEGMK
jgi:anaerobic selenocysteine-containing dehydrogenase